MAKKYFKKYLPKAGGTVAVAVAMTVALSVQANATEMDQIDLTNENPPIDAGTELADALNNNVVDPTEANQTIEASNEQLTDENQQIIEENQQIIEENQQTEEENDSIAGANETNRGGELADPGLDLPAPPEAPETEGLDTEGYNEVIGEYNDGVKDYNEFVDDYNKGVDDYNDAADELEQSRNDQYQNELDQYQEDDEKYQEYLKKLEEYNQLKAQYDADLAQYQQDLPQYQEDLAKYQEYEQKLKEYIDLKAKYDAELTQYQQDLPQYQEDLAKYQEYEQKLKEYIDLKAKYDADLSQYQKDLAKYEQLVDENVIYDDISDYNDEKTQENVQITEDNKALENDLDANNVASIDEVDEINDNIDLGEATQDILNILNGYDELVAAQQALEKEAADLEIHPGKDAALLGSAEYQAYLDAVKAYNEKVKSHNAAVEAYNAAVAAYNTAVDNYNDNKEEDSDTSTGSGYAEGNADWGNIQITQEDWFGNESNKTLNHIHVKYQAAASKDKTTKEDGSETYSENVTGYEVIGIYANEQSAEENPDNYGVNYDNDGPNGNGRPGFESMYKDAQYNEFGSTVNMWGGNVAIDPDDGTVNFYVMLKDDEGNTHGITVNLSDEVTFAKGSYYKANVSTNRYGQLQFNDTMASYVDSNGKALERVQIDGEWYYDISGKSVFVISALTCEGTSAQNGKINISSISGLDLVLNLQTMIEVHQSDNAEKINFLGYMLGKTAQAIKPADPGEAPVEPTAPQKPGEVSDPGKAPDAPIPPEKPEEVSDPGEAPEAPIPPEKPEEVTKPNTPEAPAPLVHLNYMEKLEELVEKIILTIDFVDPADSVDPIIPLADDFPVGEYVEIPDEEVPLAEAPKTGDVSAALGAMSASSALGMAVLQFLGRKKRNKK